MAIDNNTKELILIGGAALVVVYLVKQVGQIIPDFGVEDEAEAAPIHQESQRITSPWNPNFYKQGGAGVLILKQAVADDYARRIRWSVGVFSDDFSQVYAIIKSMKTQSQVSYLSDRFKALTGSDLLTWLQGSIWPADRFSAEEVNQLIAYVKKLPKYMA